MPALEHASSFSPPGAPDTPTAPMISSPIGADAKPDAPLVGHRRVAVDHAALDLRSATHGVHNTRKFRQQAVAGVLYSTAPALRDLRINQLPDMRFKALVRPLLVHTHQPRVARHISC
jgi:hypothetical protein